MNSLSFSDIVTIEFMVAMLNPSTMPPIKPPITFPTNEPMTSPRRAKILEPSLMSSSKPSILDKPPRTATIVPIPTTTSVNPKTAEPIVPGSIFTKDKATVAPDKAAIANAKVSAFSTRPLVTSILERA